MADERSTLPDYYRCGFTRDQLEGIVLKMRGISALEGDSALILADVVAWDIIRLFEEVEVARDEESEQDEIDSWDLDDARESTTELNNEVRDLERRLKTGQIDEYSAEDLRDSIQRFAPTKDLSVLGQIGIDVMTKLKERVSYAQELADRVEIAFHEKVIRESLVYDIANITSVKKIIRETGEAAEFLEKRGLLTAAHQSDIRTAQERACRHRSSKKLNQRKVILAGGNTKRAEKLLAEAQAILELDWNLAFPDEAAPKVGSET